MVNGERLMMPMPDPFASMAAALTGAAPPVPTRAEATASRFARAAEALRDTGDPGLAAMADGFEAWLQDGGDLGKLLGAKARRGRRDELPANHRRRQALAAELRRIVADEHGRVDDHRQAGKVLAFVLRRLPAVATVLRESTGARVPTSEKSLV